MSDGQAGYDPEAGMVKLTVTFNPVSGEVRFNANSQNLTLIFGMLELAKVNLAARLFKKGDEPRIAVPIGPIGV